MSAEQRPAWWPTKAQKERADKAHRDAIARRRTEIVDIESLDVGDIILLGVNRDEWRIEQNEQVADCDWVRVRFVKVSGAGEIKRTYIRFAKFETVCA